MESYYDLLGLHTEEVVNFFEKEKQDYTIITIKGYKDQESLVIPRVIKISKIENRIEITQTYFADSLK
ncbi:hypothetical protein LZ906_011135 [Paraclostridium ghonii]|uniref:hypothetical protein n=1 Tax=Paraclostridium ghonii TaxID=29358 RepID=UPI00202CD3B2|nr:hypothetical protein [Paeniclostridium ghonii]MCM0165983.1 hypothetical protein [Paeniclostridium ghonii]